MHGESLSGVTTAWGESGALIWSMMQAAMALHKGPGYSFAALVLKAPLAVRPMSGTKGFTAW